jgi:predicted nucleic acid-binding protein
LEKKKIYIDTSVISAYFDLNKPARQIITEKWFDNDIAEFKPFISTLVLQEIGNNTNPDLKRAGSFRN